jgi:hypothetical protein
MSGCVSAIDSIIVRLKIAHYWMNKPRRSGERKRQMNYFLYVKTEDATLSIDTDGNIAISTQDGRTKTVNFFDLAKIVERENAKSEDVVGRFSAEAER